MIVIEADRSSLGKCCSLGCVPRDAMNFYYSYAVHKAV